MSLLKANTIKPVTSGADLSLQGDSGGSAVDCLNITSAGDVDFTGNADAKIKLPSAGGIYKGASDTAILTESGGAVTLDNVTLGGSVTYSAGHPIQTKGASFTRGSALTVATSSERLLSTSLEVALTCKSTSNYLRVSSYLPSYYNQNEVQRALLLGFRYSVAPDYWDTPVDLGVEWIDTHYGYKTNAVGLIIGVFFETWVAVPSTTALKIQVATQAGTGDVLLFANGSATQQTASLIVQEIQT